MTIKQKLSEATKNILYKNMNIGEKPFSEQKIVLVYDESSKLSCLLGESYAEHIKILEHGEVILFSEETTHKKELQDFLLSLQEGSTVILVQSTNFRLDGFRIRLNLKNAGVGCLEHAHLGYILDNQIENYIDSIEYKTPYYEALSDWFKDIVGSADLLEMKTKCGSVLTITGGFEDIKRNTGNFEGKYRGGGFPIGENFTEAKDFSTVNGSFSVFAFPDANFQVVFCEPFVVDVVESKLSCTDEKCHPEFRELLDKIEAGEDGEVFVRELGFGINTGISKEKKLSDIGAYERVTGFHISLGKKHQIYRKKIHKNIIQRYHIDIFPDVKSISIDGKIIFEDESYTFEYKKLI